MYLYGKCGDHNEKDFCAETIHFHLPTCQKLTLFAVHLKRILNRMPLLIGQVSQHAVICCRYPD